MILGKMQAVDGQQKILCDPKSVKIFYFPQSLGKQRKRCAGKHPTLEFRTIVTLIVRTIHEYDDRVTGLKVISLDLE